MGMELDMGALAIGKRRVGRLILNGFMVIGFE